MTPAELRLRRSIFAAFASTGRAPVVHDQRLLQSLADQHVVVLSPKAEIVMAHPFAGHRQGTRVDAGASSWWGNCAWDGLGIVAALGLSSARVISNGITIEVTAGRPAGDLLFHISVPACQWWDDIALT